MIREAAELLQPIADQKSIDLEFEIEEGLPVLSLDGGGMLRVFSNLIGNAVKFTGAGGRITIRTERAGGEIVFSVSDDGDGISADDVPHVFERYWQGRQGDRRGVGLGLAIAKGIVEAHGGRIWVESGADRGATFRFALPAPGAGGDDGAGDRDAVAD